MTEAMEKDDLGKRRLQEATERVTRARADPLGGDGQTVSSGEAEARRTLKRASDVPIEDMDGERALREEPGSSSKRPAEVPVEQADVDRHARAEAGTLELGGRGSSPFLK